MGWLYYCSDFVFNFGLSVKPYELSVVVEPRFLPEQSDPAKQQFVFAYTVRITNVGERPAQVISRHWVITDGDDTEQEVRGPVSYTHLTLPTILRV